MKLASWIQTEKVENQVVGLKVRKVLRMLQMGLAKILSVTVLSCKIAITKKVKQLRNGIEIWKKSFNDNMEQWPKMNVHIKKKFNKLSFSFR